MSTSRLVRLAHSPDSDDAFMFFGLASGAVAAPGLRFEHALHDIETLNREAVVGTFEFTAISVHAYAHLADRWLLLEAGASFGDGYGPLVVTAGERTLESLRGKRIAVPGKWTSAALALSLWLPEHQPVICDFKAVGEVVKRGEADAGIVIHEGQLTAPADGLFVVEDLGRWWKARTDLPLPLGMNAVKKSLPEPERRAIAAAFAESIAFSLDHRDEALTHAMQYARGLARADADRFVGMYVNEWTRDVGAKGKEAVRRFLGEAADKGLVPRVTPEYQGR
jgi:1,4-dihydroxy-6-naphthoate synthase